LLSLSAAGVGKSPRFITWQYYWAFEYEVPEP